MLLMSARVMNTSKSIGLFSGGGAVSVLGNGGCWCCCCFLAAVRFFVDDGMVAGNIAVENSCWRVVESENAGDAICSGSGLGFVLKRLGTRWWGRRTQTQGVDAETQRHRHGSRREKLTGLLKRLENLRRTKKVPQADDVAVSWGNVDSGEVKCVLKAE